MLVDILTTLSGSISAAGATSGQLVTSTGTALSDYSYDTGPCAKGGNQPSHLGKGEDLYVNIDIMQDLTSGGSATVQFKVVQADDAALTANVEVLSETTAYAYTELKAGKEVVMEVPRSAPRGPRRFIGLQYVVGTAALTNSTGQFFAHISRDKGYTPRNEYTSGFTV